MSRAATAALLCALAVLAVLPAFAQLAPERSPLPAERPSAEADADAEAAPADAAGSDAAEPDAPEATDEPSDAAAEAETAPKEVPPDAVPAGPPMPQRLAETDLELGICLGRLASFGTVFERVGEIADEEGACGIANPVRVTEIVPGVVLSPPGTMRCETAAALAEWVGRFAVPASALLPERGALAEIVQGSVYVCRPIGNADEGDPSEHAFGNAIDVMAFRFASGEPIPVEPREREGSAAEAFQRTVRAAACMSFATVLGPGVEDHDDHLHLDVKARESGYRFCR